MTEEKYNRKARWLQHELEDRFPNAFWHTQRDNTDNELIKNGVILINCVLELSGIDHECRGFLMRSRSSAMKVKIKEIENHNSQFIDEIARNMVHACLDLFFNDENDA